MACSSLSEWTRNKWLVFIVSRNVFESVNLCYCWYVHTFAFIEQETGVAEGRKGAEAVNRDVSMRENMRGKRRDEVGERSLAWLDQKSDRDRESRRELWPAPKQTASAQVNPPSSQHWPRLTHACARDDPARTTTRSSHPIPYALCRSTTIRHF